MKFKSEIFFVLLGASLINSACWESTPKGKSEKDIYSGKTMSSTNTDTDISKTENKNNNSSNEMIENSNNDPMKTNDKGFKANLPKDFQFPTDAVGQKLLKEYGAVFIARNGAIPPKFVVFKDENQVSGFQAEVAKSKETIGGLEIELQTAAMTALKNAINEARQNSLTISPKESDAARRSYNETVGLWQSRVEPGLIHWVGKGRLSASEADRIRALSPSEQIPEIFKLEEKGMYFAKDLSKSIIYSVAPPGTSQHLSMLALDVNEHENSRVRDILAKYGWFQTVVSDLPHFTFLGVKQEELSDLGLKKNENGGRSFWIPKL